MAELEQRNETGDEEKPVSKFQWRRRILLAGATTPVVVSLYSRAAFGQSNISANVSCSESAMARGSQDECYGSGFPPAFWAADGSHLFHHNYPTSANFDRVFGLEGAFGGQTLLQVCGGAEPVQGFAERAAGANLAVTNEEEAEAKALEIKQLCSHLGAHAVAALQNAATAVPYDYTTNQVFSYVAPAFKHTMNFGETQMMEALASDLEMLNYQGDNGRVSWIAVLEQRRFGS